MHQIKRFRSYFPLLAFLLVCTVAQAQKRNVAVRPYSSTFQKIRTDTNTCRFPYIEVKEQGSDKLSVVRNPIYDINRYTYHDIPYGKEYAMLYYSKHINVGNFPSIDPALDTLPDGAYAQLYPNLPYLHGDTIKYLRAVLAVRFDLQDNLPHGRATWYLPNGQVYKTGHFEKGLKTGYWESSDYTIWEKRHKRKMIPYLFKTRDVSANFSNDRLNGLKVEKMYHSAFLETYTTTVEATYQNDTVHGPFRRLADTLVLITGQYNMGYETGEWFRYSLNTDGPTLSRYLRQHYTIADNPTVSHKVIIRSNYVPLDEQHTFVTNGDNAPFFSMMNRYGGSNDPVSDDNFGYFYRVLRLPGDTNFFMYAGDKNSKYLPIWTEMSEKIPMKNSVKLDRNDLLQTNGYILPFEGIYEEYYSDGILKLRFEVRNGELVKEDTVFNWWGKPRNVVNYFPETKTYDQKFFRTEFSDSEPKLIEHRTYDSLGNLTAILCDPFHLTREGRTYVLAQKHQQEKWEYHLSTNDLTGTDSVLVVDELNPEDSLSYYQEWYNPTTRQRTSIRHFGKIPAIERQLLTVSEYVQTFTLGELTTTVRMSAAEYKLRSRLDDNPNELPRVKGASAVYYQGQLYNGKLVVLFHQKKLSLKANKKQLTLSLPLLGLNKQTEELIVSLFPKFSDINRGYLYGEWELLGIHYEEGDKLSKGAKKMLKTQLMGRMEVAVKDGKWEGELRIINDKGQLLMSSNYQNNLREGEERTYKGFPNVWQDDEYDGQYPDKIAHYHHDTLHGALTFRDVETWLLEKDEREEWLRNPQPDEQYSMSPDTTYLYPYKMGNLDGREMQVVSSDYDYFNFKYRQVTHFKDGKRNGLYQKQTLAGIPLNAFYYVNDTLHGEAFVYSQDGRIEERARYYKGQLIDTAWVYDEAGFVTDRIVFEDGHPINATIFKNGILDRTLSFNKSRQLAYRFGLNDPLIIQDGYRSYANDFAKMEFFDVYGHCYQAGELAGETKIGKWQYMPVDSGNYEIEYHSGTHSFDANDSIEFRTYGTLTKTDKSGQIILKQQLIDLESHFICTQDEYYETRVFYTVFEKDSSMHQRNGWAKNRFDNGGLQSEGMMKDGLPTGLWKFYNPDGTLNMAGYYIDGQRDGRWLSGDLSKINYLGDLCLDPDIENAEKKIKALQQQLDVTITYYKNGKLISTEDFDIDMAK